MANIRPSLQKIRGILLLTIFWLIGILSVAQVGNAQLLSLEGKIIYDGPLPPKTEISIQKDLEVCGEIREVQSVLLGPNKGLQEVIVSVDIKGLDSPSKDPLPPETITNKDCRFLTHVSTATVTQKLSIQNLDTILHNTHVRTHTRAFINVVLLPQTTGVQKTLRKPGPMTVKCNKHPFMKGFIHVFPHRFHTVTDSSGHFMIPNLPAGTYTLSLWHETLGTIQQDVTIPAKNGSTLTIKFPEP